jgi:hypothetical protein
MHHSADLLSDVDERRPATTLVPAPSRMDVVSADDIVPPDERLTLEHERATLLAEKLPVSIATADEALRFDAFNQRLVAFNKRARGVFDSGVAVFYKRWKLACGMRDLFCQEPEALEKRIAGLIGDYQRRERAEREAEERRLAEQRRKDEEQRLKAEAKQLKRQGHEDLAEAVLRTPVQTPVVTLPSTAPQIRSTKFRKVWKWGVAGCVDAARGRDDKDALKRAAKLLPREYCTADPAALTAYANAMKSSARLPGIVFYEVDEPVRGASR